jgi:hypothetical protein
VHRYECVNVINGMQRFEYEQGVLPLQCYTITWGNLIPQCTHAHMRMTECDHKLGRNTCGEANVITLVDPEAGGRGVCLCMYIAPKDFLIKIPRPTGCPHVWTTDWLVAKWENPYGVNHRGCFSVWLVRYRTLRKSYGGWLPKGFPYVGCSWNLHQST